MITLEKLILAAPDGGRAEVYLHGAHVTSWIPAGGSECLFLSSSSEFRPGAAIRGGAPVIFPQFGTSGPLPKHGFARNLLWDLEGVYPQPGSVIAKLTLRESDSTRRIWDTLFALTLTIELGGPRLSLRMEILNPGEAPFSFTGALHTYLCVDDISTVTLEGLGGRPFIDTVGGANRDGFQREALLYFDGETDRIYPEAPSSLLLRDSAHQVEISAQGFPDCVVWNPGPVLGAKLADLETQGYRRFVCVEAALAVQPVALAPDQSWQGGQTLCVTK